MSGDQEDKFSDFTNCKKCANINLCVCVDATHGNSAVTKERIEENTKRAVTKASPEENTNLEVTKAKQETKRVVTLETKRVV